MKRIIEKIKEISSFLEEVENIIPDNYEDYLQDLTKKAACERYFEKIVEATVDLSFILIKEFKFEIPDNDKGSFQILQKQSVINHDLSKRLADAKGMRNLLAHEYGEINDQVIFHSLKNELITDINAYLNQVSAFIKRRKI